MTAPVNGVVLRHNGHFMSSPRWVAKNSAMHSKCTTLWLDAVLQQVNVIEPPKSEPSLSSCRQIEHGEGTAAVLVSFASRLEAGPALEELDVRTFGLRCDVMMGCDWNTGITTRPAAAATQLWWAGGPQG